MFSKPRILDGGLASTLQLMGHDVDEDPLWSAKLLHTNPDSIFKTHCEFLDAGATVLISASYQASIDGFSKHLGISDAHSLELIRRSVVLAQKARSSFNRKEPDVLVAGSVGPYGACLGDGSEYSGSYVPQMSEADLRAWHEPRMQALADAGADLLAFETMPALREALILLDMLRRFPALKAWLTFSCKDGTRTNYGDDFGCAVRACWERNPGQLAGVGVNCTDPAFVTPLLRRAQEAVPAAALPRIVYPNSGEVWTKEKRWEGNPNGLLDIIQGDLGTWFQLGTTAVGGCCRISPAHIRSIAKLMNAYI